MHGVAKLTQPQLGVPAEVLWAGVIGCMVSATKCVGTGAQGAVGSHACKSLSCNKHSPANWTECEHGRTCGVLTSITVRSDTVVPPLESCTTCTQHKAPHPRQRTVDARRAPTLAAAAYQHAGPGFCCQPAHGQQAATPPQTGLTRANRCCTRSAGVSTTCTAQ